MDVPEIRGSLEEIAVQKAKFSYKQVKIPLLVMDAGFFIHSLKGFPMMFTNFALQTIGLSGLLKLTEGKNKRCEFKEVLCYYKNPHTKPKLFVRSVPGTLSDKPKGKLKAYHWSELARIFIPNNETETMAEMTKDKFSLFRDRVNRNSHWEQFGRYYSKRV